MIRTYAGNGHPGFSGDGGDATLAQLRTPYGLTLDQAGNLYIADLGNMRIRRVTPDGRIDTWAGGGRTDPARGEGGSATAVTLTAPRNLAADAAGNIYFSDFGAHRVYQVAPGGTLSIVAGTGTSGFSGDWANARGAQLASPTGLAVDRSGVLYIADTGNRRIRKIEHGVITTLGDGGHPGAIPSTPIASPVGMAFDTDGALWVADPGNNQMMRISPSLTYTALGQPAQDVAVDSQGTLVVINGNQIVRRPRSGVAATWNGAPDSAYLGDGGSALTARLADPRGVAVGADGSIYVADTGHQRVRRITPGGTIETVAGTGQQGFAGDGGRALNAKLDTPTGLAIDAAGNLYIADSGNHRIRVVETSGYITTAVGTGVRSRSLDGTAGQYAQLDTPEWLAFGPDGALYFTEAGNLMVRKFVNGAVYAVAGNGTRGFGFDGALATSVPLDAPRGIAVDRAGAVYFSDSGNRRIRKIVRSLLTTVADNWDQPGPLAVDADGNVYAGDSITSTVYVLKPGIRHAVAGMGWGLFTIDSGPGLRTGLLGPMGITLDAAGRLLIVDSGNGRVRRLTQTAVPVAPVVQPPAVVVNAASQQRGAIAPGEIVTVYVPALVEGDSKVEALVNGENATLFYAGPGQVNLLVPSTIAGTETCTVTIKAQGTVRAELVVDVAAASPGIFAGPDGAGQAAALNDDGSYNSAWNPAARGAVVVLFATGTTLPVKAQVGNYAAEVLWAGEAPGYKGLTQVNVRVPGGFAPPGILPVTLFSGNAASQTGVTIAVR